MKDTCSTCKFGHAVEHEGVETTFCREDKPEFVPPAGSQLLPVRADGWCGKWEKLQRKTVATKKVVAPRSDPNHALFSKPSVPADEFLQGITRR